MFQRFFLIITGILTLSCAAMAQKMLVLYKPGTEKRFLYKADDPIMLSLGKDAYSVSGKITEIGDSTLTIDKSLTIPIRKIQVVRKQRYTYKLLPPILVSAGGGYISLTAANNAIQHHSPLIDQGTLLSTAGIFGLAGISRGFRYKTYATCKDWKFKVLDYDKFKSSSIPQSQKLPDQ